MDLIYTNAQRVDLGVLHAYELDLSFGVDESENDFEIILGKTEPLLEDGGLIYVEGTEYGGIVGGLKSDSDKETRTHVGRTWHGVLNSKIIEPDPGADYLIVSGDAHEVLAMLMDRLRLSELFSAATGASGIRISNYKFDRYVKGYDGIRKMLNKFGGKLQIRWEDSRVMLSALPVVDYANAPVDGDEAALTVERYGDKVNHLICLGSGDLAARQVLHLYVNQFNAIGFTQYYTGLDEIVDIYDYGNIDSLEQLQEEGIKHFEEIRNRDSVNVTAYEGSGLEYDVGDIIGGTDTTTGNTASAVVAQKIVKINNGAVSIEYKTSG